MEEKPVEVPCASSPVGYCDGARWPISAEGYEVAGMGACFCVLSVSVELLSYLVETSSGILFPASLVESLRELHSRTAFNRHTPFRIVYGRNAGR